MRAAIVLGLLTCLAASAVRADMPFGLAVNEAEDGDYGKALAIADRAGFSMSLLPVFWDDMMPDGTTYAPATDWSAILDPIYAEIGWKVAVVLPVIDTTEDRRPPALQGLAWDDPTVIAAFRTYATGVLAPLKETPVLSISVGNEVDVRLFTTGEWQAYGRFLSQAILILHDLRPDVPVGTTLTWAGLNGPHKEAARQLGAQGDIWLVTWYPLGPGFRTEPPSAVGPALDGMVTLAAGRPLALVETGFPSDGCGAAPTDQAAVITAILDALAHHQDRFAYVNFVWMHDISAQATADLAAYYGSSDTCFARYLGSLGLRTRAGDDKPGFSVLIDRLRP
jgi:hypothetical protein